MRTGADIDQMLYLSIPNRTRSCREPIAAVAVPRDQVRRIRIGAEVYS